MASAEQPYWVRRKLAEADELKEKQRAARFYDASIRRAEAARYYDGHIRRQEAVDQRRQAAVLTGTVDALVEGQASLREQLATLMAGRVALREQMATLMAGQVALREQMEGHVAPREQDRAPP